MRRVHVATCVAGLIVLLAGCHDPDRYISGPSKADSEATVALSLTSLPADGVSRTVITATLDGRTAPASRKVTFKTTLGSLFAGTTRGANQITVDVDATSVAVAELQSETTVGTARVEIIAGATDGPTVVRVVDVPFTALAPDAAFSLSATPTSIPADGFSRALIRARLVAAPGSTQRTVAFTALTTGLLFGTGESAGALTKTVPADSDGVAIVELQSSRNLETARVQATAVGVTREVQVTFTAVSPGTLIQVDRSAASAPADGASIVRIVTTVAPGLPINRRGVRFTTSLGAFSNDTKTIDIVADGANRAVADLRTDQVTGVANVRAMLIEDGVSDVTSVLFVPALPNRIFVSADSARVSASAATGVTTRARLLRDIGRPTDKTVVRYSAVNAAGTLVGTFSNVTLSDTSGLSTATYMPGLADAAGTVTIRATVDDSVVGSTTVEVIP